MNTHPITAPNELCSTTARVWKERIAKDLVHLNDVSIDLSNTRFIDSSGLGVLLSLNKSFRAQGGVLKLLNPSAAVLQLVELTRLHRVFEITHA